MKKHALLTFLFLSWPAVTYASSDSFFTGMEVTIVPLPHKVYAGHPHDMSSEYYFTKSIDRIFSQNSIIQAKIEEVDIDDDVAEFTLFHQKYGRGILKIHSKLDLENEPNEKLSLVLQKTLSDAALSLVVIDADTHVFHLPTCNHLPPAEKRVLQDKSTAVAGRNRECGICFFKQLHLPDLDVELAIQKKGSANVRYLSERLQDAELQNKVTAIGTKVLGKWPYPLIGYDYEFKVIQSKEIQAYALPAGAIFVTTGLIHSLENDDELEAVIAHEIAHVELRHGLQTHEFLVSGKETQAAIQILGNIAMAAAAGSGRSNAAGVIGGVTLASIVALQIQERGFSKDQEREADSFAARYFSAARKDLRPLTSIFKKMMYHNLCFRRDPDPPSRSHPAFGSRLAAIPRETTTFPPSETYHFFHAGKPVEIKILSMTDGNDETELVLGIENLDLFKTLLGAGGMKYLVQGNMSLPLEVDKYTATSAWGGVATARVKKAKIGPDQLTAIKVSAYISSKDGSLTTKDDGNSYPVTTTVPLVPGTYF